ncbi:MAG: hypothetical protein HQK79_02545 [Desulfobacterales bacterium]|nr:hypothetical protein [Desulfobacterales bacterium]
MYRSIIYFLILILLLSSTALSKVEMPPNLEQWEKWVLYGAEDKLCPTNYNDGEAYRCVFLSRLNLFIDQGQGRFEASLISFSQSWVELPGGFEIWPYNVCANGKNLPVICQNNIPYIRLESGEYKITGLFKWVKMPEIIHIPSSAAIINLYIKGLQIENPLVDKDGKLWVQKRIEQIREEDRIDLKIYRLIDDTIPMEITTHLKINISGQVREIRLNNVLLENTFPINLKSPLSTRIEKDKDMILQCRPGRWDIEIVSRFDGQVRKIGPVKVPYGEEVWGFKAENHLRMVKIEGVAAIDPNQTDAPQDWKSYPSYILSPNSIIQFNEIKRGDPEPAPDRLNLLKTLWLDFDGSGFTIQDKISGTLSRSWYLTMESPEILGRVSVGGVDQLITAHGKEKKSGIELRHGNLDLTADSRLEASINKIPAVGWDHDFETVSGVLNLPPGWRLIASRGIDVLQGTWIEQWTLLDLFLVLIIGMSIFKLKNPLWGVFSLITMILIYHENGSPKQIWLHLLAAMALLRVVPEGWFRRIVTFWGIGAIIILIGISIPFMIQQIRCGIYPQLERLYPYYEGKSKAISQEVESELKSISGSRQMLSKSKALYGSYMSDDIKQSNEPAQRVFVQDKNALIQTGPGLPNWQWKSLNMQWNGPVTKNQTITLWLLSPKTNLIMSFLRVIFLLVFIIAIIDFKFWWQKANKEISSAAIVFLFVICFNFSVQAADSQYPPKEILDDLKNRLLEKPKCLPYCADFFKMDFNISPESLEINIEVNAISETVIPLPSNLESWVPQTVLLNNKDLKGISKDQKGNLWALVPYGTNTITLIGKTLSKNTIQIPIIIKPHLAFVKSDGWDIQGISPDGTVEASIQLTRLKKDSHTNALINEANIPPFLSIKRIIELGLNWQITTIANRITPADVPLVVNIPLIDGESVNTHGIHVEKGFARINMPPQVSEIKWVSTLDMSKQIKLKAQVGVNWTETWELDASPIWHCETAGIPPIHHQDSSGNWHPTWQPWQGEELIINISKPEATKGQIITIDEVKIEITPGERYEKNSLFLSIRTSRGGQHQIILPKQAMLQVVKINDKTYPIKQDEERVLIPLVPGSQNVYLEWQNTSTSSFFIKSPKVNIGANAVNVDIKFNMPRNLWVLWAHGPILGPAVLFWSYVLFVILISIGLGKIKLTPLKTYDWLFLCLGLTQVSPFISIIIVLWLISLGHRKNKMPPEKWYLFNFTQLILVFWTITSMSGLYRAIKRGLLGIPDMQIAGNGSNNFILHWTQDRIGEFIPESFAVYLPMMAYRLLMLIWALWLVISLLKWLKWGWDCFISGGIWKPKPKSKAKNVVENN